MRFAIVLLTLGCAALSAQAQSTLHDPVPLQGNQAQSIAGNAAMGSQASAMMRGPKTSAAEFARRDGHKVQMKNCRDSYRSNTRSGSPQRTAARKACEQTFQAQRATWYAKK